MRIGKIFFIAIALATSGAAQESFQRSSFSVGAGAAMPGQGLKPSMSSAFQLRFGYGYRFLRYLQADMGLIIVVHAAGVVGSIQSPVGESEISDFEYLVPLGGRAVLPLARGRIEVHAGGGGAYLRYQEQVSVPSGVHCYGTCYHDIDCLTCASRSGWGQYATVGAAVALDRQSRTWQSLNTQFFNGGTSGESLGSVPARKSRDTWTVVSLELTRRF
jgi:hypothetical protein